MMVGTSSAGKSSTVCELQNLLDEHYLALGLDTFLHMVAPRWGGGLGGPLSAEGFHYVRHTSSGATAIRIAYGPVGQKVLNGMHQAVAALARCDNNLIVDEMLLDTTVLDDWIHVLQEFATLVVWLHAPLPVLEAREQARGNAVGLARGHLADNAIPCYDLAVDTSRCAPTACAQTIVDYLASGQAWSAMRRLAAKD